MVKIRLMRVGKTKQPSYRVVVADARSPRDGRIIEAIGHYQPRREPSDIAIDTDRAVYWLREGAQPSQSVRRLLQLSGAWATFTGEPAPEPLRRPGESEPKPQAAAVRATPAASVEETEDDAQPPAEVPEAEDQEAAAPDRETEGL
jgi:small subunit ribosomal protein S16